MTPQGHPNPAGPILLCTDGSEPAVDALRAGLEVLDPAGPFVLVTVVPEPDLMDLHGTGMAGGTLTAEQFDQQIATHQEEATRALAAAAASLGRDDLETQVLEGDAGSAICDLARSRSARAIVMGTRGRGGLRRALLGSVSDHVVRNAPCAVVVSPGRSDHD